jgi:probable rRNA maturation factor
MNRQYMGKGGTTDVLSFPLIPPGPKSHYRGQHLGDILISLDQAQRQAKLQGLSLRDEVVFLIVHSILHLIGHDHAREDERVRMQSLESKIWKKLQRLN